MPRGEAIHFQNAIRMAAGPSGTGQLCQPDEENLPPRKNALGIISRF
jgi:hypothetical protein